MSLRKSAAKQSIFWQVPAALVNSETDLPALRKRLNLAEQELVQAGQQCDSVHAEPAMPAMPAMAQSVTDKSLQAQEESATAKQRCMRAEEDKEVLQRQLNQIEAGMCDAQEQLRGYKDKLEAACLVECSVFRGLVWALCLGSVMYLLTAGSKAAQEALEAAERSKRQSESLPWRAATGLEPASSMYRNHMEPVQMLLPQGLLSDGYNLSMRG
eukprot:Skav217903  [mRNA]  locus=scaffold795:134658:137286:+ [translate_table: standard]